MLRATGHARMVSYQCAARQIGTRTCFNCSLGLGFGDGLGLWLSSGHCNIASSVFRLSNLLSARLLLKAKGASKMLRATGHARMISFQGMG